MKKQTKTEAVNENHSQLQLNPVALREKALEALAKAKELDAKKIAAGKKWVRIDHRTEVLR